MFNVIYKSVTELQIGDHVQAHGAIFEIISQGSAYYTSYDVALGVPDVATPVGKWISGREEAGYFSKDKTWLFQGNHRHVVAVISA